ncbi:hypothetical protein [Rhodococcus opacus]|uniref:hypothetical protein n=1 Tax=Rhodococcus opacus TaxID=37919 RepID=UPI0024BB32C6|nr:hypothetical protein [Rhodococcus opacus]MDJ0412833.1 hypothetical protein [Rhodococcus opacus]
MGITVLAATRMESTSGVSANAYYKRLWEVVGVDPAALLAKRMRDHFGTVAAIWLQLDEWMRGGGSDFGVSTVRLIDAHHTRIGYPLSQALLRRTDRHVLTHFWDVFGADYLHGVTKSELLTALQRWMRTDRGLSRRFVDTVGHLDYQTSPFFASVLYEAAQRWDGETRTRAGLRERPAILAVHQAMSGEWKASWRINAPQGGTTVPLGARDLVDRPMLYTEGGLQWPGMSSGMVALHWDAFEGCWLSTDRFLPGIPHALVWHVNNHGSVRKFVSLSEHAGSLKLKQLISGTVYFIERVEFSSVERLADALDEVGLAGEWLSGAATPRLATRDGLRVSNAFHREIFIQGGEPDIAIPLGPSKKLGVCLDDSESTEFQRGVALPLRPMGLCAGEHVAKSQDGSIRFETIRPGEVIGAPGHRLPIAIVPSIGADSSRERLEAETRFVSGALAIGHRDEFGTRLVVARRRCERTWLVGPSGQIRLLAEPEIPAYWSENLIEIQPLHFLVKRKASEGWLIQKRGPQYFVDEIVAVPADYLPVGHASIDFDEWREVLARSAQACRSNGWRSLLAAAGVRT